MVDDPRVYVRVVRQVQPPLRVAVPHGLIGQLPDQPLHLDAHCGGELRLQLLEVVQLVLHCPYVGDLAGEGQGTRCP